MLWALLYFYLFGGAGQDAFAHFYNDQAKSFIKVHVSDPDRHASAQESAKALKKQIRGFLKQTDENGRQLKKLFQDYSSTPAQFDTVIQMGIDEQRQMFTQLVQSRQTLLGAITHDEWRAIIASAKAADEAMGVKPAGNETS
jgi:hypothetical protein